VWHTQLNIVVFEVRLVIAKKRFFEGDFALWFLRVLNGLLSIPRPAQNVMVVCPESSC
jgi:hypothetical protein